MEPEVIRTYAEQVIGWIFQHPFIFIFLLISLRVVYGIRRAIRTGNQRLQAMLNYTQARKYRLINESIPSLVGLSALEQMRRSNASSSSQILAEGIMNAPIHEFRHRKPSDELAFTLNYSGSKIAIFKHTYSTGSKNSSTVHLKVAKLDLLQSLPVLRIEKRTIASKISAYVQRALAAKGIAYSMEEVMFSHENEFSTTYIASGLNDTETRNFLSHSIIKKLCSLPLEGTIACAGEHLLYFEDGQFTDDASYDDFIHRSKAVFDCLLPQTA